MFLRQGVRLTAVGLILGLVLAGALARAVATQFSAVAVVNPAVFTAVSTLLGGVALLATWLPARKAASVDPMIALRAD
jgi:ABC-type antimicrobial peptide transport system permease subunit